MEKLSGLVLQLKVKTGFVVGDDLEPLINAEIEKAKKDLDYEGEILYKTYLTIDDKQAEAPDTRIRDKQYETWLNEIKTTISDDPAVNKLVLLLGFEEAYLYKFEPAGKMKKTDYVVYKGIQAEISRLKTLIKSEINSNKIMSTTAFEKLNVISDTIPNLINQILSLAIGMSRIVVKKINEWSTEISNDDLSRTIDISNELIGDIALINSKVAIQSYITIYKKLKKPIEDIYKSVNEMGKLAGVISYDDNVKNQFKYTNTIGYTNRTGPRPLVPGAPDIDYSNMFPPVPLGPPAPSARLTPPAAPSTRFPPPSPVLLKIKKTINKIVAVFKAGNAPEFTTSFREAFDDLFNLLKTETLLTDQQPGDDPLIIILDNLQKGALAVSAAPYGPMPNTDAQQIDDNFVLYFDYISAMYYKKTTGASGVGETKGAGKFMHSYHAKRFL
jgi:hypothetical protein